MSLFDFIRIIYNVSGSHLPTAISSLVSFSFKSRNQVKLAVVVYSKFQKRSVNKNISPFPDVIELDA